MITAVDAGLEQLLRVSVPLPADVADISFEPPDSTWGAQLSRITVSLFLFDVSRSPMPRQPPISRTRDDGRVETRPALPLFKLSYLVSAWAGNTRDEHHLLGELLSCLLSHDVLPPHHLSTQLPGPVQLSVSSHDGRKPGEVWSSLQSKLKPSFELEATVPVDAAWELAAPIVTQVEGEVSRRPEEPSAPSRPYATRDHSNGKPQIIRRRSGTAVVAEGRPATDP